MSKLLETLIQEIFTVQVIYIDVCHMVRSAEVAKDLPLMVNDLLADLSALFDPTGFNSKSSTALHFILNIPSTCTIGIGVGWFIESILI